MVKPVEVFVMVQGCYSSQGVVGVYSSLKQAKLAHPGEVWESSFEGNWNNDKDWDAHLEIDAFTVDHDSKVNDG